MWIFCYCSFEKAELQYEIYRALYIRGETMGKLCSYDNKVMQALAKIADILIVSILWVVLCLTVVGFGPACTAAYYATAKCIRRDRGNIFKEFWHALKSNFGQSLLLGILMIFFGASLFFFDFTKIANAFLNQQPMGVWRIVLSALKFFLFFGLFLYLFPIQSRFQAKTIQIVVTSLLVMFRNIGMTIAMIALMIVIVCIALLYPRIAILMPGILSYLMSFPMEKVLSKVIEETGPVEIDETERWYLEK